MQKEIKCKVCGRHPSKINEYIGMVADGEYQTEEEAVIHNEGTYNPETGLFYCTECYFKDGMPLGKA
ncbi:hypothetical protein [Clostridium sp. UBA3887]|uniref:hypothetical protein n=1 Tax=Clostridium sp. UBA3887 TaxID=1946356 RepID=UPI00321777C1